MRFDHTALPFLPLYMTITANTIARNSRSRMTTDLKKEQRRMPLRGSEQNHDIKDTSCRTGAVWRAI